jgi:hypothetical protein
MSRPGSPPPCLLVLGTLFTDPVAHGNAVEKCIGAFGPIEESLGPFRWEWSRYYESEMGEGVTRCFFVFQDPVSPEYLADMKLFSNGVEEEHAVSGRRRVNLDPGVLTLHNVVLATGKARHQRVYVGKGIFGDLTLCFYNGAYQPQEWTYPDWATAEVKEMLRRSRERLKQIGMSET